MENDTRKAVQSKNTVLGLLQDTCKNLQDDLQSYAESRFQEYNFLVFWVKKTNDKISI